MRRRYSVYELFDEVCQISIAWIRSRRPDYLIREQQALKIDAEESEAVYREANRLC